MGLLTMLSTLFTSNVPKDTPQITKTDLINKVITAFPKVKDSLPDFYVVGVRGYYKDTMGKVGKNDRKIYDDAIFLVGKDDFQAFNANTDPAAFRTGIANLVAGVYPVYKFDKHRGKYLALCQRAGKVTVKRDNSIIESRSDIGINIHMGSNNSTSSLGCQTIPPKQWPTFIAKAQELAKKYYGIKYREKVYTYILIEN